MNIHDGLMKGLSNFSHPSRVAIIYAVKAKAPIMIYDPHHLLAGHEPKLKELYIDSNEWRKKAPKNLSKDKSGQVYPEENLHLAGLISYGGRSKSIFYQMWFTEHHPDMCSIEPTSRMLERTVWLFSQNYTQKDHGIGSAEYILQEYPKFAVRDYIIDKLNIILGWDTSLRIYPIIDAILAISKTTEEGAWPRGELSFIDPLMLSEINFILKFRKSEIPSLQDFKHIRKLLQAVEYSDKKLISNGDTILGIAEGNLPSSAIRTLFNGDHGFIEINNQLICSFYDGNVHSSTREAKLVEVEETLLDLIQDAKLAQNLFSIVSNLVHKAEKRNHGCGIVIDFGNPVLKLSGQHPEEPLDLRNHYNLTFAENLTKIDGALHIGSDFKLYGFACLLDGKSVKSENRARGARFNSALRFTAKNKDVIVVVVSSDRQVSVIHKGIELNSQFKIKTASGATKPPQTLKTII